MNLSRFAMYLLLGGILLGGYSCGKKAPPFLPEKTFNVRVSDLRGKCEGDSILLKAKISALNGAEMNAIQVKGARVYYAGYPLKNQPCEGCPLQYSAYREFGEEVADGRDFSCRVPIYSRGKVYFFKVRLIGPEGTLGPPSSTVKVVVR